jgi:ABC-type amino acid transport substrate-binding protein
MERTMATTSSTAWLAAWSGTLLLTAAGCAPPDSDRSATAVTDGHVVEAPVETASGPRRAVSFAEAQAGGSAELQFVFVPAAGFAELDGQRPTGVTVELLRDFAGHVAREHALAITVRWIAQPHWSTFYRELSESRGAVFGVGNVTITEARRDELDFSPPYMSNVAVLVSHQRQPELETLEAIGEQFAALTALVFPGTLHETRLAALAAAHFPAMPTRPVASNDELIEGLAGEGEYFAYVDAYNYWRARQQGLPLRRHPVGDDGSEAFGVILPKDSDWTPVIEAFFADGGYTRSARFRAHLDRHLGPELAAVIADGAEGD